MFPVNNSPFNGLAKVILVLLAVGILVGLALSGSDLANFITNTAEAETIVQQNKVQAQKDTIDIDTYRQSAEQRLKFQQKQAEQDLQFEAQKAAQESEIARLASYFWTGTGVFIVLCMGIGIVVFSIQIGRSRLILAKAAVQGIDVWRDSNWRSVQIQIARRREQEMREGFLRQSSDPNIVSLFYNHTPVPWKDLGEQSINATKLDAGSLEKGGSLKK